MSREEIQQRLEQWLDRALASEDPPRGVAAEILAAVTGASQGPPRQAPATTYSLWAAMTALTQEVKLQGRSFKELNDTLGTEASREAERERERAERERNLARETERRCRKEVLGVLIDLRDRLARGLESVRASEAGIATATTPTRRSWRARLFGRPAADPSGGTLADGDTLAALKKGYQLGLDRLDQTLEEFNARAIPCEGLAFDPRRMNAVDRQESSAVPEGTVIEVYRSGYEWNGEVFRPAQVKVACAPAGEEHE